MTKINGRRTTLRATALTALLGCSVAAVPAVAESSPWTFRLRGLASDYERDYTSSYMESTSHLKIEDGTGLEIGGEVRWSPLTGLDLSLGRLDFDATDWSVERRVVSFDPLVFEEVETPRRRGQFVVEHLSATWLFHPIRRRRLDLHLGPLLALARYRTDIGADREEEIGWGGRVGGDLALGETSPWSVGVELRYVEFVHEVLDRDAYGNLGLTVAALTIGYRTGAVR
ncbi:MAG: hypothetical protein AMXMBFR36_25540 [Acidobacteriota bacterium]